MDACCVQTSFSQTERNDTLNSGQIITQDQTAFAVNKNRKSNGDACNREVGDTEVTETSAVEQLSEYL